jgi:hypothetical protein
MGAAILMNSIAITEKGRIPPSEKSNSLSSGKASITRRVSRRCACQCERSASAVTTFANSLIAAFAVDAM